MKTLRQMLKSDKGATAIEYGLIASLIAVAGVAAFGNLGNQVGGTFNNVSTKMKG